MGIFATVTTGATVVPDESPPTPRDMKANMGRTDRILRIGIAAIIAILYFSEIITGMVGIVLLVAAGIFLLTSIVRFCPLYAIFGLSTCQTGKR
jgi:hypothetical protein